LLQDAIRTYHDLLTDDLAAASQAQLDEHQRRHGLSFAGRPLCTVLRPRFLTADQYRYLCARVAVLMRAFRTSHDAALADPALRRQFRLTEGEEALLRPDPGFPCPMPTSRMDAFFISDNELRCTEYNAETPAGAAYGDRLAQVFQVLPIMAAFLRRYRVVSLPASPGVYRALLEAYREWGGSTEPPRLAILDWREVPTFSEFVLFERYFRDLGLECIIADPRELEYRDGRLLASTEGKDPPLPITLIYKRVLIGELLQRGGVDQPLVRAVRDGAVCLVNPFRCKVLYKKASLAVLSDEANTRLFTVEEQEAIGRHIPWTRVVEERRTQFQGRPIDLVPFVLRQRERLVLKPNDDYGGKGIVLGWTVDQGRWEQAVRTALAEPYVVQERIPLPREPFPCLVDGRVQVGERMLDTAPFVCQGDYVDGCLTRIATDPLLNVSAGGGSTIPTFVVEPR
jgi:uncharacterized circularly permuted ATP-grasp superfamily protein